MSMSKKSLFAGVGAAVMIASVLAGCGSSSGSSSGGSSESKADSSSASSSEASSAASSSSTASASTGGDKILRVGELWAIDGIGTIGHDSTLAKEKLMLVETLVEVNENFGLKPGLAKSWKNTDENTWVFELQEGVKFHDGTDMDAEAVKFCLDTCFKNDPTHATKCYVDKVEATGKNQITIHTSKPYAELPEYMHSSSLAIFAKSCVNSDGSMKENTIIGTGPFKLEKFDVATGSVDTVRFDDYWGTPTTLDGVHMVGLTDANTRAMALENNEVDFTCDLPFNQVDTLDALDNVYVESYDTARIYQATLNLDTAFFSDKNVRQAISYAIDRDTIAKETLYGTTTPAKGIFNDSMAWSNQDIKGYAYDKDKAVKMLTDAGWTDSDGDGILDKDGQKFEFTIYTYPDRPGLPLIAEAIQAQLKDINVKVNIVTEDYSAIDKDIESGKEWGMNLAGNATAMIPSCYDYLNKQFRSSDGGYSNAEVDKLLDEAAGEFDTAKRYELSKKIQEIIVDDCPKLFICNYGVSYGFNSKVSNFRFNPTAHDYQFNTDITIS